MRVVWQTTSPEETSRVGEELAARLSPDGTALLRGDLGAGKTVLARGIARGLGLDPRQIQSPTFTIVREHEGKSGRLVHVDLYRLDRSEAEAIGIWEILEAPGVKVVEWSERLPGEVAGAIEVEIRTGGDPRHRELTLIDRSRNLPTNSIYSGSTRLEPEGEDI